MNINDTLVKDRGIDIGGRTVMPVANSQLIPALQELSSGLAEEDPLDQLFRMSNGLVMGMLRELGQ
ncbi:hypothetical protein ACQE3D_10775 [Methylomonas sp. MS20]|uniref:hypothetical protein n=1 Tax=unclassified Methylomonas TaxID=2608980 RepID=UPI0028A4FC62|nr:hypothetical protein [Methylomonas sp. MV1]MDT4328519.1 hypothetical protein [Methylomonas sp. MV1]